MKQTKTKLKILFSLSFCVSCVLSCVSCFGAASPTYNIRWINYDGSLLTVTKANKDEMPRYIGSLPKKPDDEYVSYEFSTWSPKVVPAVCDATYQAVFREIRATYTITWTDEDGNILQRDDEVERGVTPVYTGATPTKADDGKFTYTFTGWSPKVGPALENTTYVAQFKATQYKFKVTWMNDGGTVLEVDDYVPAGATPSYDGEDPVKENPTEGVSYTFKGWSPTPTAVTKDITYTAIYSESYNDCKITFVDENDEVLQTSYVSYGATPTYNGPTPTKKHSGTNFYLFNGWSPAIKSASTDQVYKATYKLVDQYILSKKASTYKIVKENNCDNAVNSAVAYFQKYFKYISGVPLDIVYESKIGTYSPLNDYIIFGNSDVAKSKGLDFDLNNEDTIDDYLIRIDTQTILVTGGKKGLMNAAVELLRQMFKFDYLGSGSNDYYCENPSDGLGVDNIIETESSPIVRYRTNYTSGELRNSSGSSTMNDYGYALGVSGESPFFSAQTIDGVSIRPMHNTLSYLPYLKYGSSHSEWYNSDHTQICMSSVLNSTEALNIIYEKMVTIANKQPNSMLTFENMDAYVGINKQSCTCSGCTSYYNQYGNETGLYLIILNKLGDMIKAGIQKGEIPSTIKGLSGLAYYGTAYSPNNSASLKAHDNVYMYLAPNYHNRLKSFKECEKYYISNWENIMNGNISGIYLYSHNDYSFGSGLLFHNDFDIMYDNYQYFKELGINSIIQLGAWSSNATTGFAGLRSYLYSYLTLNNDVTTEQFNNKINDYFTRYYGAGGTYMKQLFNLLKNSWNQFKDVYDKKYSDSSYNCAFIRKAEAGSTRPVTDSSGNCYGLASDYDLLKGVAKSKQKVLFSSNSSNTYYIGNFSNLVSQALQAIEGSSDKAVLERRIRQDALCISYVELECFNSSTLYTKQSFIDTCKAYGINKLDEGHSLSVLADSNHWNVNY